MVLEKEIERLLDKLLEKVSAQYNLVVFLCDPSSPAWVRSSGLAITSAQSAA